MLARVAAINYGTADANACHKPFRHLKLALTATAAAARQATALLRVLVGSGARRHGDGSSVLLTLW